MDYPGIDGFLGTRASLMLDVVFTAMFVVVPVLLWSVYQVKRQRRYALHKTIQITLAVVLAVAVTLFEIDMQWNGWRARACGPDRETVSAAATIALRCHLPFAVSTAGLWVLVIVQALRHIERPPRPGPYSRQHVFWARLATIDMVLTAVSGWIFYLLAFVG